MGPGLVGDSWLPVCMAPTPRPLGGCGWGVIWCQPSPTVSREFFNKSRGACEGGKELMACLVFQVRIPTPDPGRPVTQPASPKSLSQLCL